MLKMCRSIHSERGVRDSLAIKSIPHADWETTRMNETPYHVFAAAHKHERTATDQTLSTQKSLDQRKYTS